VTRKPLTLIAVDREQGHHGFDGQIDIFRGIYESDDTFAECGGLGGGEVARDCEEEVDSNNEYYLFIPLGFGVGLLVQLLWLHLYFLMQYFLYINLCRTQKWDGYGTVNGGVVY
jgi:hypothetical protein